MRATAAVPPAGWTMSVMRRPNSSSMTTTSPRAIGLPLTSRSTGLSARRSRGTTGPGPGAGAWPERLAEGHAGAADLDRELDGDVVEALEVGGHAGVGAGAGLQWGEFDLIGHGVVSSSIAGGGLLDGHVGQEDLVDLDIGL